MNKKVISRIGKIVSGFIPKKKDAVLVVPHPNGNKDKVDLINYTASNTLIFINYLMDRGYSGKKLYLVCYDGSRIEQIREYISGSSMDIELVMSRREYGISLSERVRRFLHNYLLECRCQELWSDTGSSFDFKLKRQTYVCFNYYIPFKNDFFLDSVPWTDVTYLAATSKLTQQIIAVQKCIQLDHTHDVGFPRCQLLDERKYKIERSVFDKLYGSAGKKIILYTPTFRPEDNTSDKGLFGFDHSFDKRINKLLERANAVVVVKKHALDTRKINVEDGNCFEYVPSYDYNVYDLMAYADLLISDYSSISYDFMMTDKPILLNCYDYDQYMDERGLSYSPMELFVGGPIVKTADEFLAYMEKLLIDEIIPDNYQEVKAMMYSDNGSVSLENLYRDMENGWRLDTYNIKR